MRKEYDNSNGLKLSNKKFKMDIGEKIWECQIVVLNQQCSIRCLLLVVLGTLIC